MSTPPKNNLLDFVDNVDKEGGDAPPAPGLTASDRYNAVSFNPGNSAD